MPGHITAKLSGTHEAVKLVAHAIPSRNPQWCGARGANAPPPTFLVDGALPPHHKFAHSFDASCLLVCTQLKRL